MIRLIAIGYNLSIRLISNHFDSNPIITGSHTNDRIVELIATVMKEFAVSYEQCIATVTDNASNFIKAFVVFGNQEDNVDDHLDDIPIRKLFSLRQRASNEPDSAETDEILNEIDDVENDDEEDLLLPIEFPAGHFLMT